VKTIYYAYWNWWYYAPSATPFVRLFNFWFPRTGRKKNFYCGLERSFLPAWKILVIINRIRLRRRNMALMNIKAAMKEPVLGAPKAGFLKKKAAPKVPEVKPAAGLLKRLTGK
jgi:hypothetical protein